MRTVEEIEKTVFGACLMEDPIALDIITSSVLPDHFSYSTFADGFRSILELHERREPINLVTLHQSLSQTHRLAVVSFPAITDSVQGLPRRMGEQATWYCDALKEFHRKRQIVKLAEDLSELALDPAETSHTLTQTIQVRMEEIVDDSGNGKSSVAEITDDVLNQFEADRKLDTSSAMTLGDDELDEHTGGIPDGNQVVLAARSGVGKSRFMAQAIAANCRRGIGVEAFLLEPTRSELLRSLWSIECGCPYDYVIYPWKCPEEWRQKIRRAAVAVAQWPLRIHDKATMTLDEIIGKARLGMHRYDSRLICVDYLQRVKIKPQDRQEDIRLRIGRASTAFADLVKGTKAASLILSQLNRRGGVDSIPTMQDLRESGQIENDAHTIVLLHLTYDEANGHYTRQGAILVPKRRFGLPCNLKATMHATNAIWMCEPRNFDQHWREA